MAALAAVEAREGPKRINLAQTVYRQIKGDIFEFRLLPGDRFTEGQLAERLSVSRTPVREALQRLEKEGYLEVHFRSGWSVRPLDFTEFDHLYDLRVILETAAVRQLCEMEQRPMLEPLKTFWLVTPAERETDGALVSRMDEGFHAALVEAAGNPEVARCHREVTERIRIIRQLDFTQADRIGTTYQEHAQILRAIVRRRADQAVLLLRTHIETSKVEVRRISLHQLYLARRR